MEMNYIYSTNLQSVGFENNTLDIRFHSGRTYRYFDVPVEIYQGLLNANSAGEYHALKIKYSYKFTEI